MSQSLAKKPTRTSISSASLAGDRRSPAGFIGSLGLHVAIVTATLFTWTHRLEISDLSPPMVPVDLVTLGQKTNVIPTVRPMPKVAPEVMPTPPSPPVTQPQPVVPQQQAATAPPPPPPPPDEATAEPIVTPPPTPTVPKAKPQ